MEGLGGKWIQPGRENCVRDDKNLDGVAARGGAGGEWHVTVDPLKLLQAQRTEYRALWEAHDELKREWE